MNRKRQANLKAIYDKLPKIACKGLCTNECTSLGMLRSEFVELTRVSGKAPELDIKTERCNYLSPEGRCTVYESRPFICRAYGVSDDMICYYGCRPERMMTHEESFAVLVEIAKLTGEDPRRDVIFNTTPETLQSIFLDNGLNSSEAECLSKALLHNPQQQFKHDLEERELKTELEGHLGKLGYDVKVIIK